MPKNRPCNVATSRSKRVLVVTPQPFYEDRGSPIATADLCRALGELGYEVDLLAFPIGQELSIPGVRVLRCPNPFGITSVPIGFSMSKCLLDATLLRSFESLLRSQDYAVVHALEEAAYLASVLCPRLHKPFIYDMASAIPVELREHRLFGASVAQRCLAAVERNVLRRASRVVCSHGLGSYVHRKAPGAPCTEWRFPAMTSAPDGGTVRRLRRDLRIDSDSRVVVYSGNFASYQGIDMLFDAFAQALESDPALLLVCVGASVEAREGTLSRLTRRVRSRVRILTPCPRSTVPQYLGLADCLISLRPARSNLPLKVFDYMASGKPIVATKGPAHEPVLNSDRAFMCEPQVESVAQGILEVFRSSNRARAVAQSARRHAHRYYGWDRFLEFVDGLYGEVLGQSRYPLLSA